VDGDGVARPVRLWPAPDAGLRPLSRGAEGVGGGTGVAGLAVRDGLGAAWLDIPTTSGPDSGRCTAHPVPMPTTRTIRPAAITLGNA
jgi:hypothetical protein